MGGQKKGYNFTKQGPQIEKPNRLTMNLDRDSPIYLALKENVIASAIEITVPSSTFGWLCNFKMTLYYLLGIDIEFFFFKVGK